MTFSSFLRKEEFVNACVAFVVICFELLGGALLTPDSIGVSCSTGSTDKWLLLYIVPMLLTLDVIYYRLRNKLRFPEYIFISALVLSVALFIFGNWTINVYYQHMKSEFVYECPDPTKEKGSSDIIFPQKPIGELQNRIMEKGSMYKLCNSIGAKEMLVLIEKDTQNRLGAQDTCKGLSQSHAVGSMLRLLAVVFLFSVALHELMLGLHKSRALP